MAPGVWATCIIDLVAAWVRCVEARWSEGLSRRPSLTLTPALSHRMGEGELFGRGGYGRWWVIRGPLRCARGALRTASPCQMADWKKRDEKECERGCERRE